MPLHSILIEQLRTEISRLEGFRPQGLVRNQNLGPLQVAFPNGFPNGAVHEVFAGQPESLSASLGFVSGLLSIVRPSGFIVWVSSARQVFPPALKAFGIEPERVLFVDLRTEREVPWAVEEALKCTGLAAVIGEMKTVDFLTSRRFQLAVERSMVTGFLLRTGKFVADPTACVSRWKVTPLRSLAIEDAFGAMPGIGFANWNVELLRMRNGSTGQWNVHWDEGKFQESNNTVTAVDQQLQVG
jgi:protein ImuA